MSLFWDNADEGVMILNAITDVAPKILIDTLKIGDVTIVNQPKYKPVTLSFINMKIVIICTLLGALICAAHFILVSIVHPTYLHSEDIADSLGIDILGEIPKDKYYFNNKVNSINSNEFSSIREVFSACAHVLVYKLQDIGTVCVYITSTSSKEGKTSITANLGYALSDLGYKTLIFDMDVRNPSLASKFSCGKDDSHSLNAVYRGDRTLEEAVISIDKNLDILPTRLEADRIHFDVEMVSIISSAKEKYDFVLIDTAPVGQVADALNLNLAVDCAIYIVRRDMIWTSIIKESFARFKKSGVAILGSIVNDVKGASRYYNSSFYKYQDSPYTDNYAKKHKKKQYRPIFKAAERDTSLEKEITQKRIRYNLEKTINTDKLIIEESDIIGQHLANKTVVSVYCFEDKGSSTLSYEMIKIYYPGTLVPETISDEFNRLEDENAKHISEQRRRRKMCCVKLQIGFYDEDMNFHILASKEICELA